MFDIKRLPTEYTTLTTVKIPQMKSEYYISQMAQQCTVTPVPVALITSILPACDYAQAFELMQGVSEQGHNANV